MDHAFLQLGRFGDIINLLPVLKWRSDAIHRPVNLVVAEAFASLLEGVSYVEPHVFPGDFADLAGAEQWALERFHKIIVTQVYGIGRPRVERTNSFCQDSWLLAGELDKWGTLPLVFNRRDGEREHRLWMSLDDGRPMLLVSLGGVSSPFQDADALLEKITERFGQSHNVVDLRKVQAERIYDLLGLYDMAKALVTADTATLHLSAASNIPAVELIAVSDTHWTASPPKGNAVLVLPYDQALAGWDEIEKAVAKL